MATSRGIDPCQDQVSHDPESGQTLLIDTEYHQLLTQATPELSKLIQMQTLKAHLLKHGVVDEPVIQLIEGAGVQFQQVEALIRQVQRGDMNRFTGLLKSLAESNQSHVITKLGIDKSPFLPAESLPKTGKRQYVRVMTDTSRYLTQQPCRPMSYKTSAGHKKQDYTAQTPTSHTFYDHDIMAEGAGIRLSDYGESVLISQVTDLKEHLNNKIPVILGEISFNPLFLARLIKSTVIDDDTRDNIQALQTKAKMGEGLFKEIKTVGHLRGLLMALAEDNQDFIITNMGFDPDEFKEGSPTYMKVKQHD